MRVRVIARVRPARRGGEISRVRLSKRSIVLNEQSYAFANVSGPEVDQRSFYDENVAPLVLSFIHSASNVSIFTYGQTSSGKTHTMYGDPATEDGDGVVFRAVEQLFELHGRVTFHTGEVYMEKLYDLSDGECRASPLPQIARDMGEFRAALDRAMKRRHTSSTLMNAVSSRSHSYVRIPHPLHPQRLLSLFDLAGSERSDRTGATGVTRDEGNVINRSLTSLGSVISHLSKSRSPPTFRNSKLTMLLRDALTGESETAVILCCSPMLSDEAETRGTLEFGLRAQNVRVEPAKPLVTSIAESAIGDSLDGDDRGRWEAKVRAEIEAEYAAKHELERAQRDAEYARLEELRRSSAPFADDSARIEREREFEAYNLEFMKMELKIRQLDAENANLRVRVEVLKRENASLKRAVGTLLRRDREENDKEETLRRLEEVRAGMR